MAFFYSFTDSLKQKWLQFYQVNRDWIRLHMEVESVYTPDGGKRPSSYLILGVANALEPKLAQLMLPFSKLNADADTLVEVLDLHFDPDIELGHGNIPVIASEAEISESEMMALSDTNGDGMNGFGEESTTTEVVDTQEATLAAVSDVSDDLNNITPAEANDSQKLTPDKNGFDQMSVNMERLEDSHNSMEADDTFGDISFDELDGADSDQADTSAEMGFDHVVSDVWGDEKLKSSDDPNHDIFFEGEDTNSESLDEAEIARLFPNS